MKKIAALLSLIIFLFLTKSSVNATGYCNFSPEGANGQPYGDVTISSNCVIYESVNGTSLGNLTLQNSVITLNSTLVFSPGKQISIGPNSIIYINTNGKITQNGLCIKDADNDGYADVITLDKDPESGLPLANPITQIGKVEAGANGNCPSGYRLSDTNVQNLTIVDADPLTASATTVATSDRELLRLGFMINGVTDALAAVGDLQVVDKNILVCTGGNCPTTNFTLPDTGNIYTEGKIGVGTAAPSAKIHIDGGATGSVNDFIGIRRGGTDWRMWVSDGSTSTPSFRIGGNTVDSYAWQFDWTGSNAHVFRSPNGTAAQNVVDIQGASLQSGKYLSVTSSAAATGNIFSINGNGNVGIGTTIPGAKLEVANGDIRINRGQKIGAYYDVHTNGGTLATNYGNYVGGSFTGMRVNTVWDGTYNDEDISFYTHDGGISNTERMRIDKSGNVGIGTTAPGQKLEVNGDIRTTPENSLPNLVLDSTSVGDNWTAQGAYISIGENGALGSAAMHMTYTGDGYGYTGAGTVTAGVPAGGYWRYQYNLQNIYTPATVTVGALSSGTGTFSSTVTTTGQMYINNASPTIYFKDTDHRGAMLHNNSNLFYVLRGCEATNSTTWCQVGGVWPFVINLETNAITTGGSITATSDIRLKTNIQPLPENTLDKVKQLRGVYFNWKTEADMGNVRQIGVIAQEVEKIFPELVITSPDGYKAVGYDRLGPILIEAIKEQQVEIDSLKSQVTDLKNELDEIKQFLKMPR